MRKLEILQKVLQSGIVAIVRTDGAEKAKKLVSAINEGGIKVIEVTMSVPNALDVIKELSVLCAKEQITMVRLALPQRDGAADVRADLGVGEDAGDVPVLA